MPYLLPDDSAKFDAGLNTLAPIETEGELNYVLTRVVQRYLAYVGGSHPHYADFNNAVGALECCKQELYRRAIAPYEDVKAKRNQDVYGDE